MGITGRQLGNSSKRRLSSVLEAEVAYNVVLPGWGCTAYPFYSIFWVKKALWIASVLFVPFDRDVTQHLGFVAGPPWWQLCERGGRSCLGIDCLLHEHLSELRIWKIPSLSY